MTYLILYLLLGLLLATHDRLYIIRKPQSGGGWILYCCLWPIFLAMNVMDWLERIKI